MQETLSGLTEAQSYSLTPPLLMPMNAGFLDSPCFSVRYVYQASHVLSGSGVTNATWKPLRSSSTSVWGSWSQ